MKTDNIAFIYTQHNLTRCFRVAKNHAMSEINYIIVTCSPTYNGVYRYSRDILKDCESWNNKKLQCWCIPIDKCVKVQEIKDIKREDIRKKIIKQQKEWFNSQVENRDYEYKNKPEWMIW